MVSWALQMTPQWPLPHDLLMPPLPQIPLLRLPKGALVPSALDVLLPWYLLKIILLCWVEGNENSPDFSFNCQFPYFIQDSTQDQLYREEPLTLSACLTWPSFHHTLSHHQHVTYLLMPHFLSYPQLQPRPQR